MLFALISAYLGLVIITRVESVFLPGRQITLPGGVGNVLPGVDSKGVSGGNDPINILVMGLDRRPSEGVEPTRSDTLFVLRVDPKTDSAAILGIPRDLMVDIPLEGGGSYQDRVNTVYVQGELTGYPGGGIGLMKEVLQNEPFGISIDKYVIVDFEGFESLIDALGGVDVDVPDEVYDPYYSETELPGDYLPQHFLPGNQHMDGVTALAYSRIRFSSDDLDRIQRQQRVIFAAIDKAKSQSLLDAKDAPKLWEKYQDTIQTDINDALILGYADLANQVKDNLIAFSLGSVVAPYTTSAGAQVLVGDPESIATLVKAIFSDAPIAIDPGVQPTPQPVVVQVQNGAGVDGLAADISTYIIGKGYPQGDVLPSNVFDGLTHARSEIIDIDGTHDRNGYQIALWLGIPVTNYRPADDDERATMLASGASLLVILGTDYDFTVLDASAETTTTGG